MNVWRRIDPLIFPHPFDNIPSSCNSINFQPFFFRMLRDIPIIRRLFRKWVYFTVVYLSIWIYHDCYSCRMHKINRKSEERTIVTQVWLSPQNILNSYNNFAFCILIIYNMQNVCKYIACCWCKNKAEFIKASVAYGWAGAVMLVKYPFSLYLMWWMDIPTDWQWFIETCTSLDRTGWVGKREIEKKTDN